MHRRDGGDHRDMRTNQLDQRRDLARMIHSDLEHAELCGPRHERKRERHAPVIIVGRGRCMGLALPAEHKPQRLLGRCLADRPGDGDDPGGRTRARGTGEIVQRPEHVRNNKQRRILRVCAGFLACHNRETGARLQRGLDELVAIAVLALDCEERLARLDRTGVDRKPAHALRQRARTRRAHGGHHGVEDPERLGHATFSFSAAATASWSLNGSIRSPTIWPLSWPFPATSKTSPGCKAATARRIASPRSPISVAPRVAVRIAARIAAGFSLRGLSSVTITASAFSAAIAPISGRLPESRSPPAPNTTTSLRLAYGRSASSALASASGWCA